MEQSDFEKQLTALTGKLETFIAKAGEEIKVTGAVSTETKSSVEALGKQVKDLQTQLDAVDEKIRVKHVGEAQTETITDLVMASAAFKEHKAHGFIHKQPIHVALNVSACARVERKATITDTGLGSGTSGVLMPTRLGVVGLPMQEFRLRDLIPSRPLTTGTSFDWVKQTARSGGASPQVEGSPKSESTYTWDIVNDSVRPIAHFVNVSRQALDDVPWLRRELDTNLIYGLKLKEEAEILAGAGTGVHLNGIITQATSFNTSLLHAALGWQRLDILRYAKLQVRLAGLATFAPSGYVLHPTDMAEIELTKDGEGLYIVGDPKTGAEAKFLWGLPVVESDSITAGTFLVGAFATGAEIIDRMATSVQISFEHDVNFTSNLATILAEERIGLAVKRPDAFVTGTFNTSPAS